MHKFLNIIIGAGFSKALCNFKDTKELDKKIFQEKELEIFYKSMKNDFKLSDFNFETAMEMIYNLAAAKPMVQHRNDLIAKALEEVPNDSFEYNHIPGRIAQIQDDFANKLAVKISTVLKDELSAVNFKENERTHHDFANFLNEVLKHDPDLKINIFDLNFDEVFEYTIKENNLESLYENFFDCNLEIATDKNVKFFNPTKHIFYNQTLDPWNNLMTVDEEKRIEQYSNIYQRYCGHSIDEEKARNSITDITTKRIFHFKLHGALKHQYLRNEEMETLNKRKKLDWVHFFPYITDTENEDRENILKSIVTGENKFRSMKKPYYAAIINSASIFSRNPTLYLGYSFRDLHLNIAFGVDGLRNPVFFDSPSIYLPKPPTYTEWLIKNSIEDEKDFHIQDFLNKINQLDYESYEKAPENLRLGLFSNS